MSAPFSTKEIQFVQRLEELFDSNYDGPSRLRTLFEEELKRTFHYINPAREKMLWKRVSKAHMSKLLAVQSVSRVTGNGQLSLYVGDVFSVQADQWILSSFQDEYSPFGGVWVSFWKTVHRHTRDLDAWNTVSEPLVPNKQVASIPIHPVKSSSTYPTIVIHGRYSSSFTEFRSTKKGIEKAYHDALFALRNLSRQSKIGRILAMPVLFSSLHGVEYKMAIELQKEFAIDVLLREPHVREVMIVTFDNSTALLGAYHQIIGDSLQIKQEQMPQWLVGSVEHLSNEIRQSLSHIEDEELSKNIMEVLSRINAKEIYLNDVAVLTRNTLERWAFSHNYNLTDKRQKLYDSINKIRTLSGTPNRSVYYIDGLRELGNVGAHQKIAPHPLEEEDLITLLLGIKSLLKIHLEIIG